MCCFVHTTIKSFLFCPPFIGWSTSNIYKLFFSLWLVCSQCLLIQFTAVVVTAGAASKYLILFTQYWSRSSWWTCHEAHDLYCNRACYATFWKAQGTESWWHTEVTMSFLYFCVYHNVPSQKKFFVVSGNLSIYLKHSCYLFVYFCWSTYHYG